MNRTYIFALAICFCSTLLLDTHVNAQSSVQRVLCGGIQLDTADKSISAYKVEAALALALELTDSYQLIPNSLRDSLAKASSAAPLTIEKAADKLGAEIIIFCNVGIIGNLVRMETVIVGGVGWIVNNTGVGYALSFYRGDSAMGRVIDPAILQATQRSLCHAFVRPELYSNADSSFRVYPTELAAVGGFEFVDTDPDLVPWSVFREKISASYDIAQTIVASLRRHDKFTVIDLDTRDSIYALAGLYMVENYNTVSNTELTTLKAFEVKHIITGRYQRMRSGAELTLVVNSINADASFTPELSESVIIPVDSKLALQDGVRYCLRKLFGGISEPLEQKR